jgi:DNA-binding transcriptional LysR family regulator
MKPLDLTRFDPNLLVVMDALLDERHVGRAGVIRRLDAGGIDVAIGTGSFMHAPRRIEVIHLFEERFAGIARAGHPLLRRRGRRHSAKTWPTS